MALLYRILMRLAAAWLVIFACIFGFAASAGGLATEWRSAVWVLLGPPLAVGILAWIIKPAA